MSKNPQGFGIWVCLSLSIKGK